MPHAVTNQPPPQVDYDVFEQDQALAGEGGDGREL
jgi:hypothetical protein